MKRDKQSLKVLTSFDSMDCSFFPTDQNAYNLLFQSMGHLPDLLGAGGTARTQETAFGPFTGNAFAEFQSDERALLYAPRLRNDLGIRR